MFLDSAIAQRELRKVAHGKASRVPVPILIQYTLNYLMRGTAPAPTPVPHDDSLSWCEALYALKDKRHV